MTRYYVLSSMHKSGAQVLSEHATIQEAYAARDAVRAEGWYKTACVRVGSARRAHPTIPGAFIVEFL